ncbi:MAG: ribokinase [Pseudomonadota bacterium]
MLTIFGSINLDISTQVIRLPSAGETVLGSKALISAGGKGANQAHAARRFGMDVQLIGAVGEDMFAGPALQLLGAAGVDLQGVRRISGAATGLACIGVTVEGDNAITVAPGANLLADARWIPAAASQQGWLLLQLEVPVAASMAAARLARAQGRQVMLNAAPAVGLELIDWASIDWLIVNRIELNQLCAQRGISLGAPLELARLLARDRDVDVAVTLGDAGALVAMRDGKIFACPALRGDVLDSTGAGDTFSGVFAAALAQRFSIAQALRLGVAAAGLACRRRGAQAAQPSRPEIDAAVSAIPVSEGMCA